MLGLAQGFAKKILASTNAKDAICIDNNYNEERDERVNDKIIKYRNKSTVHNADFVMMMDVLEHVDDDVGLLREYIGKVQAGSYFLITVPAFSFLWSDHDVYLEHKRRYTITEIENVIDNAGLKIVRSMYIYSIVFFPADVIRYLGVRLFNRSKKPRSHLKKHSIFANTLLKILCANDRVFVFPISRIGGLSMFSLAKKI